MRGINYTMTAHIMGSILSRMKCRGEGSRVACSRCGKAIEIGDRVTSKQRTSFIRRYYHHQCYEGMFV